MTYQLIVAVHYTDDSWREYQTVSFVGGDSEPLVSARGDVSGCDIDNGTCGYIEYLGAPLNLAFLDAHAKSGFEVQISGDGSQNTVPVPAPYVQGFLAALPGAPATASSSPPIATGVR
jgi:hypothetical protein